MALLFKWKQKELLFQLDYGKKVLPMDICQTLIRSILASDIEDKKKLGIYECHEEDFVLCSLICRIKVEVSQIIKDGLDLVKKKKDK